LVLNERYVIESELGRGGMSRVFTARDVKLGRHVAIKFLAPNIHDDAGLRRFEQEARAAGSLNHPNVLTLHDIGMHEGNPYIVSELLEGATLRQHLEETPVPLSKAMDYARQLVDGLAAAHEKGITHRDLKPENLFVTTDGRLKILDFGIAKLAAPESEGSGLKPPAQTQTGTILGTMGYMSPEQARGEHADPRSDIFSTGAIVYEMLSGKRAFKAASLVETAHAILNDEPPELPEQVPVELRELVWRCLDKKPEVRFQSAGELAFQLRSFSAPSSGESETDSSRKTEELTPQLERRWRLRWPFTVAAATALLAAFLLVPSLVRWRERSRLPAAPINTRRSVAVLGFKNLTGHPEQAWLSTALSEMLTTELAAGEKLRTVPEENVGRMKVELSLKDAETLAKDSLLRVRKNLGADLVVVGAYVRLGEDGGGQMRLDVRLQDAAAGDTIGVFAETGTESNLFDLVSRAGAQMRKKLGVGEVSTAEVAGVQASLPSDPDAARLYAEGLAKLQRFDSLGARELLQTAVTSDPQHALAHSALAAAWSQLGYDENARAEAKKALDLSANLSREKRLWVEARYWEVAKNWGKATEIYGRLFSTFPDDLDYGLRLAEAQIGGGRKKDALATIEGLRKLPAPARDDARIDLAEAAVASNSDPKTEQMAARKAAVKADAQGARLMLARARLSEGHGFVRLGETATATVLLDEAKRIYAEAGDRGGVALVLQQVGSGLYYQGDLNGARQVFEQVLAIDREIGNKKGVATALNNIAGVLTNLGDLAAAKNLYEESLATLREIGDKLNVAGSLGNIGNVLYYQGDLAGARKRLEESLAVHGELGTKGEGTLYPSTNLAAILFQQGELPHAKRIFIEAEGIAREVGSKRMLAHALSELGDISLQSGNFGDARRQYDEALEIRNGMGEKGNAAITRLGLAAVAMEEQQPAQAATMARAAEEELRAEKHIDGQALANVVLGKSLLAQGKLSDAQEAIDRATSLAKSPEMRFQAAIVAARVRAASGKFAEASKALKATLAEATRLGFIRVQLEARLALGEAEMTSGKSAAGRSRLEALRQDASARGFALIARKAATTR
jgi:serine/threonine protein kinase/tetratricopeptide (TPR) repeat protein